MILVSIARFHFHDSFTEGGGMNFHVPHPVKQYEATWIEEHWSMVLAAGCLHVSH